MAPHEKVRESHFRDLRRVILEELIEYRFVLDPEGFEITDAHGTILGILPLGTCLPQTTGVMENWSDGVMVLKKTNLNSRPNGPS